MIRQEETILLGKITKSHGTKGEVEVKMQNDLFMSLESDCLLLCLDGILVPFFINEERYKNDETLLLSFCDIQTEKQAQKILGAEVYALRQDITSDIEIADDHQALIGYQVIDTERGSIGTIRDIDTSTINTLLLLDNDLIIPLHDDFLTDIDYSSRTLTLTLPQGLI